MSVDPEPVHMLLASKRCSECLVSGDRIVPGSRAAGLIRECRENDVHFQCHKGSLVGLNVHCRGVHDIAPSRAYRFALEYGIEIREIDPDSLGEGQCSETGPSPPR